MLAEIAAPGRWIPEELEHDLYVQFTGGLDNPANTQGIDKAPLLSWWSRVGIAFVDLAHLLSDMTTLKHIIQKMNNAGMPQLITVADESQLYKAVLGPDGQEERGAKLHNWADSGMGHVFVRVGYSDSNSYGLYFEPAAPGFTQPVPILWSDIERGGLVTVVAVYPHGMAAAPENFDWVNGIWPEPAKPAVNIETITQIISQVQSADAEMLARLEDEQSLLKAKNALFMSIMAELGAKV